MNIAIIIHSFCESTFSFVEAWAASGHFVDLYYITDKVQILNDPGFETNKMSVPPGHLCQLTMNDCRGASQMLKYPGVHFFYYRIPTSDYSRKANPIKWIKGKVAGIWYMSRLSKIILQKGYDYHEIIYPSSKLNSLLFYFSPKNTLVSFHEICENKNKENIEWNNIHNSLKIAIHKGFNIRFFSNAMMSGITYFVPDSKLLFNVIPFGPYTMFRDYVNDSETDLGALPKDYVLYLGYIYTYKGLEVLWEATELLKKGNKEIHVVVAGNGTLPVIDKMKASDRYTVINRFITNSEIVQLIKNCKAVVCPYIGCSQSGLPMTAYPFGKPVIATSIGDFPKVVLDKMTGIIIPPNDAVSLADAIYRINTDNSLYNGLVDNIAHLESVCKDYSWTAIVEKYRNLLCNLNINIKSKPHLSLGYINTIIKSVVYG